MTADPILVLAALVLAHLVADFHLQSDSIVADKSASGIRVWRGLGMHGLGVAGCLLPFVVAFGGPGIVALAAITVSHLFVDRGKVLLTRRAEARAIARARTQALGQGHRAEAASPVSLGPAWTPAPAGLFVLDQVVHLAISGTVWVLLLAAAPPVPAVSGAIDSALGGWDRTAVNQVVVALLVAGSVVVANVRGGMLFVATLVHPREVVLGTPLPDEPAPPAPAPPVGWRLRLGPLAASVDPEPAPPPPAAPSAEPTRHASPARVGATIGILERLLIVTFVITGSEAAIGFVVAAKTLARFRQLDDRDFAEYYLLGTLASVAVALATGLLAKAALTAVGL